MVLEATMICIDNSEWMRNGDYLPSRLQAQLVAVKLICGAKIQSNRGNTVGILTMGGKRVRVLITLTSDLGKILSCIHGLEIGGEMSLTLGIQVAQLALKHNQNRGQQQRIIVFAGSPIKEEKKFLEAIGKNLKKNRVALDIVDFGEADEGKPEKLEALIASVNNNDNSHIVRIPPGSSALSDVLISTPIFMGQQEGASGLAAAAGGGITGFCLGVDPEIDPELAIAIRISMEEEIARKEAAKQEKLALSMSFGFMDGIDLDDDELISLGLQMLEDEEKSETEKVLEDQSLIPEVDPNDPSVKDLLASLQSQAEV